MWCSAGDIPLIADDQVHAIGCAVSFAIKVGRYVLLLDQAGNAIARIPPALQCDGVHYVLFEDYAPDGDVRRN